MVNKYYILCDVHDFIHQTLYFSNLDLQTLRTMYILPLLPFPVYPLDVTAHPTIVYQCIQFKPAHHVKRKQKSSWTKNVHQWKTKSPKQGRLKIQRHVLNTYLIIRQLLNDKEHSSEISIAEIKWSNQTKAFAATNKGYKVKRITFDSDSFKAAVD